ncbi:alkyl sulfatase dimerization domain-containing protein [Novosphingobium sp. MMS21-SN21R]|uniref:alkyl sulfatase dimerization domain-containing protein n=1 Tax=Novosphingobium sp. MMS21-SN21R TaxID=2969298 RepID=UPI0028863D1D|nr:alkyl sulfatase dimerization domain-containing protein [Novosphingobium sp. MMS21-SN21R]MDT0509734.1 alkyl sulfatase dimerization domain-containing protein [Novosphingobium sp. MMS21-SN21R]
MTRFRTLDHPMIAAIAWKPDRPAEWISDHVVMNRATSNAYLIPGDAGDVVINTGTAVQGEQIRKNFEALIGRPLKVTQIVFTQSHPDHTGGWQYFADEGVETIVQRKFERICAERKLMGRFFGRRNAKVLAALIPPGDTGAFWFEARDPEPLTEFADSHDFTVSGRHYQALSIPSGETLDALAVWMPQEKTLFFGNWAGAIMGASPNFYTARGDRDRSIVFWLEECQMMIDLGAEMLVTGHDDPITGAEAVRAHLTKLRDAVQYLHDETVAGMNEGKTLPELMAEIALPPHLVLRDGRGPVNWYVRAIWEEYAGWFRQERTSELYATPPSAVWPEVVALAGGAGVLAEKSRAHLAAGDVEKALHLIEMAVVAAPDDRTVRETELAVYEALADRTEGRVFDELGWLESAIIETRRALDAGASA